jgi:hypothetical protein
MRILTILTLFALVSSAAAEQFWIEYDASSGLFPEECGWTRTTHGGGAVRSLADGVLTLDSTADQLIADYYRVDRPITPGPGETFVATWRVRVGYHSGYWEALAYIHADDGGRVLVDYKMDRMRVFDEGWQFAITPGVFHTYRIESNDMDVYTLSVDGSAVHGGVFHGPGEPIPFVDFGDIGYGGDTLTRLDWEYFGFGIIPEPSSLGMTLATAGVWALRRS